MADHRHQQATLPKTPKRKREDGDGESEESAPLCCHKHEQQDKEEQGEALMSADRRSPKSKREDDGDGGDDRAEEGGGGGGGGGGGEEEEEEGEDPGLPISVTEYEPSLDDGDDLFYYIEHVNPNCDLSFFRAPPSEIPDGDKPSTCGPQVWANYHKQVAESQGFDIEDFPGICAELMNGDIVPLTDIHESPRQYRVTVRLAKVAIKNYNAKNKEAYVFHSMEKVNARSSAGHHYYITFRVKNLKAAGDSIDASDEHLKVAGDSSDDNLKAAGDSSDASEKNLKAADDFSDASGKNLKAAGGDSSDENLKAAGTGGSSNDGDENLKAAADSSDDTDDDSHDDSDDDGDDENLKAAGDDIDDSSLEIFQAEVWERFDRTARQVYLCRPKPEKIGISSDPDAIL